MRNYSVFDTFQEVVSCMALQSLEEILQTSLRILCTKSFIYFIGLKTQKAGILSFSRSKNGCMLQKKKKKKKKKKLLRVGRLKTGLQVPLNQIF